MKLAAVTLGMMTLATSLSAFGQQDEREKTIFLDAGYAPLIMNRTGYYLNVVDEVSDGCLPQPNRVKDKIEVAMRRNGLDIIDKTPFSVFRIHAMGYATSSTSCAVRLEASIKTYLLTSLESSTTKYSTGEFLVPTTFPVDSILLTGSKDGMQERIEEAAQDMSDRLYLDINRARDFVKKEFPEMYEGLSR